MAIRTRRDAWKLSTWDPILLWYAKGIHAMQQLAPTDPRSWAYQAAIHDFVDGSTPHDDPIPGQTERDRFWGQCQHFSWFFLPWHRMYLLHFERTLAAFITQLGGPADWALPYWNYSDASNPDARRIPKAFRELTLPDGSANPLRIDERDAGNAGEFVGEPEDVDICSALRKRRFVSQGVGGDPGFGGGESGFSHGRGFSSIAGELERVPHGSMHVAVGGFMSGFDTAGLDPLFWLHHSNIDRLWEVWRQRNSLNVDPTQTLWLSGVSFPFHDSTGQIVTMTSKQVVKLTAPLLDYAYEDVTDDCSANEAVTEEAAVPDRRPEMIGATSAPVRLGGAESVATLSVVAPSGPVLESVEQTGAPPEVYLNLENITGNGRARSYSVYLNVPEGDDPEQHRELFAGVLPMFGLQEASRSSDVHAGSGLHYTLDITPLVQRLEARQAWDPNAIRVSFVPRAARGQTEAVQADSVQIGRVSLYVG